MAESDYTGSRWGLSSTSTVTQGSELPAPHLNAHAPPFAHPFPPPYYATSYSNSGNSSMLQCPYISNASFGTQVHGTSPYSLDGSYQRPVYHPPPSGVYPTHPRLPSAFHNAPVGPRTDMSGFPDVGGMFPRPEYPTMRNAPGFTPLYPHGYDPPWSSPNSANGNTRRYNHAAVILHPHVQHSGGQDVLPVPSRTNSDRSRQVHFHNRRPSQQELHQHNNNRSYDLTERRVSMTPSAQGRRSDRSISPRTSARRSYDRFSHDLSQFSTSSDVEEAAARVPPSNRARHRPREPRPRFFGHPQHHDPNVATPRQIQELKEKLQRRLPSELPEGASTMCDICSKDYSSTHVHPVEEEEIAIELPCGHCFGEFCIFQWFDTCRTHKNKVTCPMCRKQLIEPSRYHPALLSAISRGGPAFQEMLANELRGDFAHM